MVTLSGNVLQEWQIDSIECLQPKKKVRIILKHGEVTLCGIVRKCEYAVNEPHLLCDVILDGVRVNVMDISTIEFV